MNRSMLMLAASLLACGAPPVAQDADASTTLPGKDTIALPVGCGPAGELYRCDPIDNAGCAGARGEACDVDPTHGFGCYPSPNNVTLGGDCNVDEGPSCAPALSCATDSSADGTCAKFCCMDADCAANQRCAATDPTFGTLGVCK